MHTISAIIFDLGDVLLDLDQDRTLRQFNRLGLSLDEVNLQSTLFTDFECGKISAADFRQTLKAAAKGAIDDEQIDEAWNRMLLSINHQRLPMLQELQKLVPLYLLSNTNSIHIDWFHQYLHNTIGLNQWNELFTQQFLSYEIGLRKPNLDIYEYVTSAIGLAPKACLFIDDNKSNISGATKAGLKTLLAQQPLNAELHTQIKQLLQ
jgi:glucose-1-phosphatase